jgi:hypothetical protein
MRVERLFGSVFLATTLAACAGPEREWMKVSEKYTVADFRRDHAACSRGARLDEACMRARGWVDVNPGKVEKPPEPERHRASGQGTR